jgi:hypothetical protein
MNFLSFLIVKLREGSEAPVKENIFMMANEDRVSLREALNLMHGRAVYREPAFDPLKQGYWMTLNDAKQNWGFGWIDQDRNGFRVEKAMSESILCLGLDSLEMLKVADALKRGDRVPVNMELTGLEKTIWAEVDPRMVKLVLSEDRVKQVALQRPVVEQPIEKKGLGHDGGRGI